MDEVGSSPSIIACRLCLGVSSPSHHFTIIASRRRNTQEDSIKPAFLFSDSSLFPLTPLSLHTHFLTLLLQRYYSWLITTQPFISRRNLSRPSISIASSGRAGRPSEKQEPNQTDAPAHHRFHIAFASHFHRIINTP